MQHTIRPLRKKKKDGTTYRHSKATLDALEELLSLPDTDLEARSKIHRKEQTGFITNPCLVYLVRTSTGNESLRGALFESLLIRISQRVRRQTRDLPVQFREDIVEEVVSKFIDLLVNERTNHVEDLDSLETAFRQTVVCDCLDAFRKLRRKYTRHLTLERDDADVEAPDRTQRAVDETVVRSFLELQDRARLNAAIAELPELHAEILKLTLLEYPVHSNNGEECMTKILKRSEKSIHQHRAAAIQELEKELQGD